MANNGTDAAAFDDSRIILDLFHDLNVFHTYIFDEW